MSVVYKTKTLKELQLEGSLLTDIADDLLIYVESGNAPFVITGATLKSVLSVSPAVDNSITVVLNGTAEKNIEGVIEKISFAPTVNGTVKIGTTFGGGEILSEDVVAGESFVIAIDYLLSTVTTIYFTGPASTLKLKIW